MPVISDINRAIKNWKNYNRTVRELSSLDNRALADLGITRTDIRAVAKGQIY